MGQAKKLKGRKVMLFLDEKTIALTTSCDITISANYNKSASKDSGKWDDMDLENISYSGSNDSFMTEDERTLDLAYDALIDKLLTGNSVPFAFGSPTNIGDDGVPEGGWEQPTTKVYKGNVKITSVRMNTPAKGDATLSVSFEGCSPLSKA